MGGGDSSSSTPGLPVSSTTSACISLDLGGRTEKDLAPAERVVEGCDRLSKESLVETLHDLRKMKQCRYQGPHLHRIWSASL
ncbi:unnamed protein product [Urochloa humidicola]